MLDRLRRRFGRSWRRLFRRRRSWRRWPAGGRGPRLARLKPRFARVRSGDGRLAAVDSAFDKQVVRPADEQQMLGVVAPDDDELAFAVEFERVDDIQAARAVARSVGP